MTQHIPLTGRQLAADGESKRTIRIASGVFLAGAVGCEMQRRTGIALLLATIGFELVFVAESNIDWRTRLTRRGWKSVFERRYEVTILGQAAQWLAFACLIGCLVLQRYET